MKMDRKKNTTEKIPNNSGPKEKQKNRKIAITLC
jgi:hypothetical protein